MPKYCQAIQTTNAPMSGIPIAETLQRQLDVRAPDRLVPLAPAPSMPAEGLDDHLRLGEEAEQRGGGHHRHAAPHAPLQDARKPVPSMMPLLHRPGGEDAVVEHRAEQQRDAGADPHQPAGGDHHDRGVEADGQVVQRDARGCSA